MAYSRVQLTSASSRGGASPLMAASGAAAGSAVGGSSETSGVLYDLALDADGQLAVTVGQV